MGIARLAAIACCVAGSVALVGCRSDDDMEAKHDQMMAPGMSKADAMKADDMMTQGQMKKDKGMMMKNNGRTAEGDRLINEGDKMMMDAKAMKEKAAAKGDTMVQ